MIYIWRRYYLKIINDSELCEPLCDLCGKKLSLFKDKFMNKKLKQLIKKHVDIVKSMYPELYIEVDMVFDDILVGIDSHEISEEERYEDLIYDFAKEYESKGYFNIHWGVSDKLPCDNLALIEDFVKTPVEENLKQRVVNF